MVFSGKFDLYAQNNPNADSNSEKDNSITIEWRKVPYASGYILQIRNEKKQNLIDQKTISNSYTVNLKPGNYEQRIGVINKFGRLERFSDWSKVKVVLVLPPEIPPKESPYLPNQEIVPMVGKNPIIRVPGKNFVNDTEFQLQKNGRTIEPSQVELNPDGSASLTFPDEYLQEGNWDLVVKNPKDKTISVPNYARIHSPVSDNEARIAKEEEIARTRKKTIASKDEIDRIDSKPEPTGTTSIAGKGKQFSAEDRWAPVWRSALLPGWGHFYMEDNKKGWIHSGVFTLSFLFLYSSRENLIAAEKTYNNTLNQSLILQATNPGNLGIRGLTIIQDENKFQEFRNANQNYNISLFILLGFYFYQLYDSYSDSEKWYYGKQSGIFIDGGNRVVGEMDLPQVESYWKAWFSTPIEF